MQFHHAHAFRGPVAAALQPRAARGVPRWLELGAEPVTAPGSRRDRRRPLAAVDLRAGPARGGRRRARAGPAPRPRARRPPRRRGRDRARRRRRAGPGRAGARRVRPVEPGDPGPRRAGGLRGRLRHGLRRPAVPAAAGRRARPAGRSASRGRATTTATGARLPARAGRLLDGDHAATATTRSSSCCATTRRTTRPARRSPASPPGPTLTRAEPLGVGASRAASLLNHYRGQRRTDGAPLLRGLVVVGDAVGTTTPNFGRGITLALMQAERLLAERRRARRGPRRGPRPPSTPGARRDRAVGARPRRHGHRPLGAVAGVRRRPRRRRCPRTWSSPPPARTPGIAEAVRPYLSMAAGPASLRPAAGGRRRRSTRPAGGRRTPRARRATSWPGSFRRRPEGP